MSIHEIHLCNMGKILDHVQARMIKQRLEFRAICSIAKEHTLPGGEVVCSCIALALMMFQDSRFPHQNDSLYDQLDVVQRWKLQLMLYPEEIQSLFLS